MLLSTPGRYPGTSTKFNIGILNASQKRINLEALSEQLMSRHPAINLGWLAITPMLLPFNLI
jgi:hypothetical protein